MEYINIDTVAVKVEEPVLESVENVNTALQIKNVVLTSSERDKVKTTRADQTRELAAPSRMSTVSNFTARFQGKGKFV